MARFGRVFPIPWKLRRALVASGFIRPANPENSPDYGDAVLGDYPVAWWRLAEQTGATVTKDWNNDYSGTYAGSETFQAAGPLRGDGGDYGVTFDGATGYADVSTLQVHNNSEYSVEFWVKAAAQSGNAVYAEASSAASLTALFLGSGTTTTSKLRISIRDDGGSTRLAVESVGTVFDSTWHHFVFTDSAGAYALYVDGALDSSGTYTKNAKTIDRTTIGAVQRATNILFLSGTVSEVAVYDHALPPARIATHYYSGLHTYVTSDVMAVIAQSTQVTSDVKLVMSKFVSSDVNVAYAGTYRGEFYVSERTAGVPMQAGDVSSTYDLQGQSFYTGAAYIDSATHEAPLAGDNRYTTAPTTGGWRIDIGDATYPIRFWDGTNTNFSLNNAGAVVARSLTVDPQTNTSVALTVTNTAATNVDLARFFDLSSNRVMSVGIGGEIGLLGGNNFLDFYDTYTPTVLSKPSLHLTILGGPIIAFGPGGTTVVDTNLYRSAANVLKTDDQFVATDGVTSLSVAAAGKITGADGDFTVTPGNGTIYVIRNSTTGDVRLAARSAGAWKVSAIMT